MIQVPKFIAIHWSASNRPEKAYHINVLRNGNVIHQFQPTVLLTDHTYHHNTNTVAIAAIAMDDANFEHFGPHPITQTQVEAICSEAASLTLKYSIPVDAEHVFTHAEIAFQMGYGPYSGQAETRWDFMLLEPQTGLNNAPACWAKSTETGDKLRSKINWYRQKLQGVTKCLLC